MKKLTLDLHPIFRNETDVDRRVRAAIFQASRQGIEVVEIIPGKGSGTLKARVLGMLKAPHMRKLYRRLEVDPANEGRIVVHFDDTAPGKARGA